MPTIRRLSDSCLLVTTDQGTDLIDPGFHTFDSGVVDLDSIGDVQRVLITHEHGDHVKPEFVAWLVDRSNDVHVYSNRAVTDLLARHDIECSTDDPAGITIEDVAHATTPMGTAPPNRAFTVDGVLTHPGDSYEPSNRAPVLALPLLTPWGSMTQAMEFAKRMAPDQAVPIHDFYLSESGRAWTNGMAKRILGEAGIEFVPLDWGERYSF